VSSFSFTCTCAYQMTEVEALRLSHLKVRYILVAFLRACVVGELHVPEAGHLVDQEGVLFDHSVEDVLQWARREGVCVSINSDFKSRQAF